MFISINLQDSLTPRSLNFHAGAVISRQTLCCAQKAPVLFPDILNMFEGDRWNEASDWAPSWERSRRTGGLAWGVVL